MMTNDLPYDDRPTFDATRAEATPERYAADEPAIVPPPSRTVTTKPLPVPRARRQVKDEADILKQALKALTQCRLGEGVELNDCAIDALVCATLDLQLPLDAEISDIGRRRQQVRQGNLTAYIPFAMDELEDALATLEAALAALKAISMLDEPIPTEWGNLGPLPLARKLNVLGHTLLRGRIPGVSL